MKKASRPQPYPPSPDRAEYKEELYKLQVELVKVQKQVIAKEERILVLFEGRDASGKDGTIKRITAHLSPRETRVVALGKPSDRDKGSWYFQRFVPHLPAAQEMVLFNRSWYNRAGVERVMGFCTDEEYEEFLETVPIFEQMLYRSGIKLFKYYLDIGKEEQKARLKSRRTHPLKQWKISPVDEAASKHWKAYSQARNAMFSRTHSAIAPWSVVRANDKRLTRINIIKNLLSRLEYPDKDESLALADPAVVFPFMESLLENGMIEP